MNYIYGYDANTLSQAAVDFVTRFPTYTGGSSTIPYTPVMKQTLNRFVSAYGNVAYTFKNRYTVSASARKDASNLFGVNTNQKWVPLWSTGALWQVGREPFYDFGWLPVLNIRLTYGVSGNLDPSSSGLAKIAYYPAYISSINLPFASITAPPNPELRWEQVRTFNAGIDFSIVGSRLSGSLEYYNKSSIDLMNSVPLDPVTGFLTARQNSASLSSKGVDVILHSININREVTWKTTLLFNYITMKVTKNLDPPSTIGFTSSGTTIFPLLGYNPYLVVSNEWAGLDPETGDPLGYLDGKESKDYNALRNKSIEEQVISGPAMPPIFGSIRNTLEWNKFTFAANVVYKLKYYLRKPTTDYTSLFTDGRGMPDFEQRWKQPGDEQMTNVPSMLYPANAARDQFYKTSVINVIPAGNIRLTDIYFSYDWNPKMRNLTSVKLYLYMSQINFLIWRKNNEGIDPEVIYNLRPPVNFAAGIKINL